MASLAVVLIVIAVILALTGVFLEGAHWLLVIGIVLLIGAVIYYLVGGARRGGPPAI